MVVPYLSAFALALLFSLILTRFVRNWAVNNGWIPVLASHHIHERCIPRLGGVAIFFSFVAVTILVLTTRLFPSLDPALYTRPMFYVLAAGSLIFLIGVFDDFRSMNPYVKFSGQVLAGVILYLGGFKILNLPVLFGWHEFGWVALPLTVLWVLLITNAFNLIDGLDGLAAGSSLFSTFAVFVVALSNGSGLVAVLALILAGSIAGFLKFNFNPATIFLGDSGSLFIGFMLAALALVGSQKSTTIVAVAIPVVSFGLPLLETLLSVFRRFLNGQPLFRADREHIHHKLLDRGYSQRQAVILLYGVSALFGFLSLFLLVPGNATVGLVLLVVGVGVWIGVQQLGYHEILELKKFAWRTMSQKPIMANNLAIRRATERLSKVETFVELSTILQDAFEMSDFAGFELKVKKQDRYDGTREQLIWHKSDENAQVGEPLNGTWTLSFELTDGHSNGNGHGIRNANGNGHGIRNGNGNGHGNGNGNGHRNGNGYGNGNGSGSIGSFKLYRECNDRQILADINLLTLDFREALGSAVDRVLMLRGGAQLLTATRVSPSPTVEDTHKDEFLVPV